MFPAMHPRLWLLAVLAPLALAPTPRGLEGPPCVSRRAHSVPAAYADAVARARALVCERLCPRTAGPPVARALVCERLAPGMPGIQVAVAVDGRLVWSEGFGYADVERRTPVTAESQFRIGSVSKPLTATAVALLYEQRKLDLDARVQPYAPPFPGKTSPITPGELGGPRGGIRHYRDDEFLLNRHFTT